MRDAGLDARGGGADSAVPDAGEDAPPMGSDAGDAVAPTGDAGNGKDAGADAAATDAGTGTDAGADGGGEDGATGGTDGGGDSGAVNCDDGNPCTTDTVVNGMCVHTPDPGASCDDGIACTTNDVCTAQGSCAGTVTSACNPGTCGGTQSLGGTIDIPVANTTSTITLGGQPLPATNEYGTNVDLYFVAKDTGQWHTFATFGYNSNLFGPTVTPRLVPGVYDVYYCHGCSTAPGGITAETDPSDAFPGGLRVLQSDVVVGAGSDDLAIDIPVTQTSATITLGGQPLPATNEYGTNIEVYLVSRDTGQWHTFATFGYNSNLFGPTVTPRVVPGAYDVYYCHGCSTTPEGITAETDPTDAFPGGLRVLQSNIVVSGSSQHLAIDIPVAQTTATITLGGQPLPATNEYGTNIELYLVAHDTGQWHTFATFGYNSNLFGPSVTPRVVPGDYDVYYCHGCSTTPGGITAETDPTDAFPGGLRILQSNVTVPAGPANLAIDIPVAQTTAKLTLAGQPLPATNEYGTNIELYLVSRDTGQWHTFATFGYNSNLFGPTVTPRVVPGVYDVYYCHGCSTTPGGITAETDPTDAFPGGLRILQSGVTVPAGSANLAIDIPVTQTNATLTLGGQPLPATNEYGTNIELYFVAHDTGQWHTFATFGYNSNLFGPTVTPRLVPGVYDVYYCHGCSTTPGGITAETDPTDAFPGGLRVVQKGLTVSGSSANVSIDIPVIAQSDTITLAGKPLPPTNEYGTNIELYLVSRDTGQWHTFATFGYNSNLFGPTETPRVVPGTYDVYYCHGCSTTPSGITAETDATDAFPGGLRILGSCVSVP
jgi:hypothetical protein